MNKLITILESVLKQRLLKTRRSKEERGKNHIVAIHRQIQQYIKDGRDGDLDLYQTQITSLPDDLEIVDGELDLGESQITSLPDDLTVTGDLILTDSAIEILPRGLRVEGELGMSGTGIREIPPDLRVDGGIVLLDTYFSNKIEHDGYSREKLRAMFPSTVQGKIVFKPHSTAINYA
jgi:hypothetical protein